MSYQQDPVRQVVLRTAKGVKQYTLERFSDYVCACNLIYAPRFERVLEERWEVRIDERFDEGVRMNPME